ncbi:MULTISPECIES: hypothetical protein [Bradyrhizobium]|jgi:hypothetical protein|nr:MULTISPECIES: hypothetical protein [Bradyrhizobium]
MIAATRPAINRLRGWREGAPTLNSRQHGVTVSDMEFSGDIKGL